MSRSRSRSLMTVGLLSGWAAVAAAQPQDTPPPPPPPPADTPAQDTPPPPPADAPTEPAPPTTTVEAKAPTITSGTIRGRVISASGDAAASAIVSVGGTTISAIADGNGNFELLDVPGGAQILYIDATGYAAREDAVEIVAGRILTVQIRV